MMNFDMAVMAVFAQFPRRAERRCRYLSTQYYSIHAVNKHKIGILTCSVTS